MEYKTTLRNIKKSKGEVIMGIALLIFVVLRCFYGDEGSSVWTYWYIILYLPISIILILDGLGFPLGKNLIDIDTNRIVISSGIIYKMQTVFWNNIDSIEITDKRLFFRLKNNKNTYIVTMRIPDKELSEIRNVIFKLSESKNIEVRDLTL